MASTQITPSSSSFESRPTVGSRFPATGLVQFGVPLGVSGLAGAWTAAETMLGAQAWVEDVLWIICGLLWLTVSVTYVAQRFPRGFSADLKHPVTGPFAAYVPLLGTLLMTHFGQYIPDAAPWIVWFLVASSLLVAAQLFAHWMVAPLDLSFLHPGYFIPLVAAAFVGSLGLASVHQIPGAQACFGIGMFFWLVIGTIVTGRLMTGGPLIDAVRPTLVVLLVPPALGGIAWLFLTGGQATPIGYGFAGIVVTILAVQLVLIPEYRKIPVSISYWTFTFPASAVANFTIRWWHAAPFAGSVALSWVVLTVATVFVASIATATILKSVRPARDQAPPAEKVTA